MADDKKHAVAEDFGQVVHKIEETPALKELCENLGSLINPNWGVFQESATKLGEGKTQEATETLVRGVLSMFPDELMNDTFELPREELVASMMPAMRSLVERQIGQVALTSQEEQDIDMVD